MANKRGRFRGHLGPVEYAILDQISTGDLFVGMLLSARSTNAMYATARARALRRQITKRAIDRMLTKGLIELEHDGALSLTPVGISALEKEVAALRSSLRSPEHWDGKWRLVTFDVPEVHRVGRDALRSVLKRAGFMQLQRSVWIHPFDCEELQELLATDPRLSNNVIYALLDKISYEKKMLKHFNLVRK